ncbi:MAG: hypothetical protein IT459_14360 [Planctomycetes bacterium]|nr:hypothetical protein [Planctomycetota bacterium]
MTVYLDLTREFNVGRLRAVICSGQAAVLHRLAIASKDGDWILREDAEALEHVLGVLGRRGARYRFGAPLDLRWLVGGWSAHFEFQHAGVRVRTDFMTRPPRVGAEDLARMWLELEGRDPPFTGARILAAMKKTDRQKDYPFIGELARKMPDPRDRLLFSRSAEDLIELAHEHPSLVSSLVAERPLLARIGADRRALAEALQLEMLDLIEENARRIASYRAAMSNWEAVWPALAGEVDSLSLREAHARIVERAAGVLPERVTG